MLEQTNKNLRKIFALLGVVFFLFKLIEKIEFPEQPEEEGFQTKEFDDIW